MNVISYKSGVFLVYGLLDALYRGDVQACADRMYALGDWCAGHYDELSKEPEYAALCEPLAQLTRRLDMAETTSLREYNVLRSPLAGLLASWMDKVKLRLYLHSGVPSAVALAVRKEMPVMSLKNGYNVIPNTDDNSIHVLLTESLETLGNTEEKIDAIITLQELLERARYCFPIDAFDYDRLYLSGKLQGLTSSRNDVSIALGGSSYAMVGLKEKLLPRPAVNLAVNAQDPYFAFLSVEAAKKACKKIDTAVIAGGYYFWHTDMSDNPSGYYKSVLTRTNYPVLKSMHNYKGELLSIMQRAQSDPFMEKMFDFRRLCAKENNKISVKLAALDYFNSEINPRPANGMLQFSFREQSDEVNEKAAKARAQAHNGNFNRTHLEDNIRVFSNFLLQMKKHRVRVILLIPPVTKFYRQFSEPALKESLYELLEPVKKEYDFTFIDLFDSSDFDVFDFQDYDHLNDRGAEKLSKIVTELV